MFNTGPDFGESIGQYRGDPLCHASLSAAEYSVLLDGSGDGDNRSSVPQRRHHQERNHSEHDIDQRERDQRIVTVGPVVQQAAAP
jgi:hypothetical protein